MEAAAEAEKVNSETEDPQEDVSDKTGGADADVEPELPNHESNVTEPKEDEKSEEGLEDNKNPSEELPEDEEDEEYNPNEDEEASSQEDEDSQDDGDQKRTSRRSQV